MDADAQPLPAFRARENVIKALEHLMGLARGLTCDGQLNVTEMTYLVTWVTNQELVLGDHPIGRLVIDRIARVLSDGIITDEERRELCEILSGLCGGDDAAAGGLSMAPPVKEVQRIPIDFPGKRFVVTGKFLFGPRARVHEAILQRGGIIQDAVSQQTEFVILGTLGSRDWTNSAFGTKLEKVYALREKGHTIHIIPEPDWAEQLR